MKIDATEVFILACDAEQEGLEPLSGVLHGYEFGAIVRRINEGDGSRTDL